MTRDKIDITFDGDMPTGCMLLSLSVVDDDELRITMSKDEEPHGRDLAELLSLLTPPLAKGLADAIANALPPKEE